MQFLDSLGAPELGYYYPRADYNPAEEQRREKIAVAVAQPLQKPSIKDTLAQITELIESDTVEDIPEPSQAELNRVNAQFARTLFLLAAKLTKPLSNKADENKQVRPSIYSRSNLIGVLEKICADCVISNSIADDLTAAIKLLKLNANQGAIDGAAKSAQNDNLTVLERACISLMIDQISKDWQNELNTQMKAREEASKNDMLIVHIWKNNLVLSEENKAFTDRIRDLLGLSADKPEKPQEVIDAEARLAEASDQWHKYQAAQFALQILNDVKLDCRLQAINLQQEDAIEQITQVEEEKWKLGYSTLTSKGGHAGVVTPVSEIGGSVSVKATVAKEDTEFMDYEGYMAEVLDQWAVGLTVEAKFSLLKFFKANASAGGQVVLAGKYAEYLTAKTFATVKFDTLIKKKVHHNNPQISPNLSRTHLLLANDDVIRALSPVSTDQISSELENEISTKSTGSGEEASLIIVEDDDGVVEPRLQKVDEAAPQLINSSLKDQLLKMTKDEVVELDQLKAEYDLNKERMERRLSLFMSKKIETAAFKKKQQGQEITEKQEEKRPREHDPVPQTIRDLKLPHAPITTPSRTYGVIPASVGCYSGKIAGGLATGIDDDLGIKVNTAGDEDLLSSGASSSLQFRNRTFIVNKRAGYGARWVDPLKKGREITLKASPWWWPFERWPFGSDVTIADENQYIKAEIEESFNSFKNDFIISASYNRVDKELELEAGPKPGLNRQGLAAFNIYKIISNLPETEKFHNAFKLRKLLSEKGIKETTDSLKKLIDETKTNKKLAEAIARLLSTKGVTMASTEAMLLLQQNEIDLTQTDTKEIFESKKAYTAFIEKAGYDKNLIELHDLVRYLNSLSTDKARLEQMKSDKERIEESKKATQACIKAIRSNPKVGEPTHQQLNFDKTNKAELQKCFEYIREEYSRYKSLQADVANGKLKNTDGDDVRALLRQFERRYGAINPEQLLHRLSITNAYLLTNLFDGENRYQDSPLRKAMLGFEGELLNPPYAVDREYLKEHCYYIEDIEFRGMETKFEIESKPLSLSYGPIDIDPLKFKLKVSYRNQTHTNMFRRGDFWDIAITVGGKGSIGEDLIGEIAPTFMQHMPAEDAVAALAGLEDYLNLVAPTGSFSVEQSFIFHFGRPTKLSKDSEEFPFECYFVRMTRETALELGLSLTIPIGTVDLTGGVKYSKSTVTPQGDDVFANTWWWLIVLNMHEHNTKTIDMKTGVMGENSKWRQIEQEYEEAIKMLFIKYANEREKNPNQEHMGALSFQLAELKKAIEKNQALQNKVAVDFLRNTGPGNSRDTTPGVTLSIADEFKNAEKEFQRLTKVFAAAQGSLLGGQTEYDDALKAFRNLLHAIHPLWYEHRWNSPLSQTRKPAKIERTL